MYLTTLWQFNNKNIELVVLLIIMLQTYFDDDRRMTQQICNIVYDVFFVVVEFRGQILHVFPHKFKYIYFTIDVISIIYRLINGIIDNYVYVL